MRTTGTTGTDAAADVYKANVVIRTASTSSGISWSSTDDIVLDDFGPYVAYSTGSNFDLDSDSANWATSAVRDNPLVADDSIPNCMVLVTATVGSTATFTITVPAGETLILDVDGGSGALGSASHVDTAMRIDYTAGGVPQMLYSDDSACSVGGDGSVSATGSWGSDDFSRDSYLTYTNDTGEAITLTITLGEYINAGEVGQFNSDQTLLLNVSLTGHAATGTVTGNLEADGPISGHYGNDLLSGSLGNDAIYGGEGSDHLYGGAGNDTLFLGTDDGVTRNMAWGGAGDDILVIGAAADYLDGGAGRDQIILLYNAAGTTIDLAAGTMTTPSGSGTVINIENVKGTTADETITGDDAANLFWGDSGNDTLNGGGGDDILSGDDGDDTIHGDEGNDSIYGGAGGNMLFGDGGDDSFYSVGNALNDMDGGAGNDRAFMESVTGVAGETRRIFDMVAGTLTVFLGDLQLGPVDFKNFENLYCGETNDTVHAVAGAGVNTGGGTDTIYENASAGSDVFHLEGGDDTLVVANGRGDSFDGGQGRDTIDFSAVTGAIRLYLSNSVGYTGGRSFLAISMENVVGSGGNDIIYGNDDINSLAGGAGNDILGGGAGVNIIDGGSGIDTADYSFSYGAVSVDLLIEGYQATGANVVDSLISIENVTGSNFSDNLLGDDGANVLSGRDGDDKLYGRGGDDRLLGGAGRDKINGDDGADFLDGGLGVDTLAGGWGDDVYVVDNKGDLVFESADHGTDTIRSMGIDIDLANYASVERVVVVKGAASVTGDAAANVITGSFESNALLGGGGNDTLYGGGGADRLDGGGDADILIGGAGTDLLTGGLGKDNFNFAALTDTTVGLVNADVIADFSHAEGDRIVLKGIDAITGGADDAFAFIGTAAFSNTAGELRYRFDGAGNTIVSCDIDGNGVADMSIILTGEIALVAGDFVL